MLQNNSSSSEEFETFNTQSNKAKLDLTITKEKWHNILNYVDSKIVANLAQNVNDAKVKENNSILKTTECETCAFIKTHQMISRRLEHNELTRYLLERIKFDLILMIEIYNDDKWISHFVCYHTHMNFVWTHSRKNDALSVIKKFVKMTIIRFDHIVRFIRIDDEQTLSIKYENFMKLKNIFMKRIVSYTSIQNEKIERSEWVLIARSRAMRISSRLSFNLWSEIFKTIKYLNNEIFRKSLN